MPFGEEKLTNDIMDCSVRYTITNFSRILLTAWIYGVLSMQTCSVLNLHTVIHVNLMHYQFLDVVGLSFGGLLSSIWITWLFKSRQGFVTKLAGKLSGRFGLLFQQLSKRTLFYLLNWNSMCTYTISMNKWLLCISLSHCLRFQLSIKHLEYARYSVLWFPLCSFPMT